MNKAEWEAGDVSEQKLVRVCVLACLCVRFSVCTSVDLFCQCVHERRPQADCVKTDFPLHAAADTAKTTHDALRQPQELFLMRASEEGVRLGLLCPATWHAEKPDKGGVQTSTVCQRRGRSRSLLFFGGGGGWGHACKWALTQSQLGTQHLPRRSFFLSCDPQTLE